MIKIKELRSLSQLIANSTTALLNSIGELLKIGELKKLKYYSEENLRSEKIPGLSKCRPLNEWFNSLNSYVENVSTVRSKLLNDYMMSWSVTNKDLEKLPLEAYYKHYRLAEVNANNYITYRILTPDQMIIEKEEYEKLKKTEEAIGATV